MRTISEFIQAASRILGKPIDDEGLSAFLRRYSSSHQLEQYSDSGNITCAHEGFDIPLRFVNGEFVVDHVRLLSPRLCKARGLSHFPEQILQGLAFPLRREDVRRVLGEAERIQEGTQRFDAYEFSGFCLQFIYPRDTDEVAFVSISRPSSSLRLKLAGVSPEERISQLCRGDQEKWSARYHAYKAVYGEPSLVIVSQQPQIGPLIDIMVFESAEGYYSLVTNGMSNARMPGKHQEGDKIRAELELHVRDLRMEYVGRLASDAAFPFIESTTIKHGDTIHWGVPIVPQSVLTTDLIIYSPFPDHRNIELEIGKDKLDVLCVLAINEYEYNYKINNGIQSLLDLFDRCGLPAVVDPHRKSCV